MVQEGQGTVPALWTGEVVELESPEAVEMESTQLTTKPCPRCGALSGETCIRPDGRELLRPHAERR